MVCGDVIAANKTLMHAYAEPLASVGCPLCVFAALRRDQLTRHTTDFRTRIAVWDDVYSYERGYSGAA